MRKPLTKGSSGLSEGRPPTGRPVPFESIQSPPAVESSAVAPIISDAATIAAGTSKTGQFHDKDLRREEINVQIEQKPAASNQSDLSQKAKNTSDAAFEQSKVLLSRAKEAADATVDTVEASFVATTKGVSDIASKLFDAFKSNASAAIDHLKLLTEAKTFSEIASLQREFIRKQADVTMAQSKEIAELTKKMANETSAPIRDHISKTLPGFGDKK